MDNVNTRIIDLIERAARQYNAITPCHSDWKRSYTIEGGVLRVWFNFPVGPGVAGLSTGLVACKLED